MDDISVFGTIYSAKTLHSSLEKAFRTNMELLSSRVEIHRTDIKSRLATLTLVVRMESDVKTVSLLVKETTETELIVLSLLNKLLPFSVPKIIMYQQAGRGFWVVLENVTSWVDIGGRHRVNESLLDGLYTIHRAFYGREAILREHFDLSDVSMEDLVRVTITALQGIEELSKVISTFTELKWEEVAESIRAYLSTVKDLSFPKVLLHGSYCPSSCRAFIDSSGETHVIAYDWQFAALGWPQIDLVVLLDRLTIIAEAQGLLDPSPSVLQRYVLRLVEEFGTEPKEFYEVFRLCYLCRATSLVKWWASLLRDSPQCDPKRAYLEIESKLKTLKFVASNDFVERSLDERVR